MQKVRTKFANSAFQSRKKCINLNIKILQQKWTNHKNPKNVASSALHASLQDNLSAENSKLSADFCIHFISLFGCMGIIGLCPKYL